jgi:hypothetical protein
MHLPLSSPARPRRLARAGLLERVASLRWPDMPDWPELPLALRFAGHPAGLFDQLRAAPWLLGRKQIASIC